MRQHLCAILGFLFLALLCSFTECRSIVRRQISLDASLDPALQEVEFDDEDRDKRAVEHTNDPKYAKFAIKNALLGFVFNKINTFIDQKTQWVNQLDYLNIPKNAALGIYPPQDGVTALTGAITGVIGSALQAAGPLISIVTSKIASGSLGGSASGSTTVSAGGGGGNILGSLGGLLGGGGGSARAEPSKGGSFVLPKPRPITTTTKRPTTTEDIVIFEKNQAASLEIPSQLFGGGFSLITKLSNTAGDYMINSAIRFQRLLEVFRPMIISMFGAKGLVSEVTTNKPIFSDGSTTR